MRRIRYAVTVFGLVLMGSVLAGCADGFDLDKLDVFGLNEKKKLPGDRKELFPGGVPGVTQGIPPEYMKGNQPPPETAQAPANDQAKQAAASSKTAAVEDEPKAKPKPKSKPKPAATRITVGGSGQQQQPQQQQPQPQQMQQAPWPQDSQPAQQQSQSPWPTQGQTNAAAPWPSSPNSGTISR
jgi:hypothetical protein